MLGLALPAVEFGAISNAFDDFNVSAIWVTFRVGEDGICGGRISLVLPVPQLFDHCRWQGDYSLSKIALGTSTRCSANSLENRGVGWREGHTPC
jgi:hypothetical protein